MIDTLLTEVSGRAGDKQSYVQRQATGPLARIRLIDPQGVLQQQDRQSGDLSGLKITGRLEGQGVADRPTYTARLGQVDPTLARQSAQPATMQMTDLSSAGRLIARLFADIPRSTPIEGQQPLMAIAHSAENGTAAMATALKQSVNHSGLFFEAQILAWIRGRMSKAEVMRNPQAGPQLGGVKSAADDRASPHDNALRQQLEVHAGSGFSWRGEAWPGAELEWHLHREAGCEDSGGLVLQSDIRLTMTNLGMVEARIRHQSHTLEITAWAERPESSSLMKASATDLRTALLNHGYEQVEVRILTEADGSVPTAARGRSV